MQTCISWSCPGVVYFCTEWILDKQGSYEQPSNMIILTCHQKPSLFVYKVIGIFIISKFPELCPQDVAYTTVDS